MGEPPPARRKRFGQHFLKDPSVARRIVVSAGVGVGDRVLEVGPGEGILTDALRAAGASVVAIELDRDLIAPLQARFPDLDLRSEDALGVDWQTACPGEGWQVVANLPYNVATPLILNWIGNGARFRRLTVMVQEEVAARFVARPGDDAWSRLSVAVAVRARTTWVFGLGPEAFRPPPKVRSAVVRIEPFPVPDFGSGGELAFNRVVSIAFGQRRKTVRNALLSLWNATAVDGALAEAGVDGRLRAEVLSVDVWRRLGGALPTVGRAVMPPGASG